jgi:hypothetical protein
MRTFTYQFTIECASDGTANEEEVERLIDLNMQDLTFDDTFIEALDEEEAVTIQVTRIG